MRVATRLRVRRTQLSRLSLRLASPLPQPGPPLGVRAAGPDTVSFLVDAGAGPVLLAELDGRYLSTEVATGFSGRVIGMYVTEGSAAFDWFTYEPTG